MPIRYQHVETVATTPDRVFAAIDDLPLTAKWLPPCVSLSKIGDGPNAPGDKLRYVFKQGGRQSEMAGEILARVLGERLHCKYSDSAFDVSVDLRVAPAPGGALTTHIIEISPETSLSADGRSLIDASPLGLQGLDPRLVGAATNEEPRELDIPRAFLGPGQYQSLVVQDGDDSDYRTHRESYRAEQKLVTSADTIHFQLAPGGGACILLKPSP